MSKPVTVRLADNFTQFLENVRGDLTVAEAIRSMITYLMQFDPSYTKNILREIVSKSTTQEVRTTNA